MSKKFLKLFAYSLTLLCAQHSASAIATSCEDNFAVTGSFFTGKVYKTWSDLPAGKFESAYKGAYLYTLKNGWKLLSSDKDLGVFTVAQAGLLASGKTVPLNVAIEKSDVRTKISITYTTPAGVSSPEDAVKLDFCKTISAAESEQSGTSNSSLSNAQVSIRKPETEKAYKQAVDPEKKQTVNTEFVKDGMPCLNGICIGDEISSLSKIKWNPSATQYRKVSNFELQERLKHFIPGANKVSTIESAYQYFGMSFDNEGITKLSQLTGYCTHWRTFGEFKSDSGFETTVLVFVMPAIYPEKPALRVAMINRTYPTVYTADQIAELGDQFKQRYAGVQDISKQRKFLSDVTWHFGGRKLELSGAGLFLGKDDQFKQYPGCGKTLKVD
ncbi:MAG: hypothetical protein V4447_03430 [Pseudomonadota bacterium]